MISSFLIANLSQTEAEFRTILSFCWAGLIVIAAIVVAAFALRSWKTATLAVIFVLLYGVLLKPWRFLVPIETDASGDRWSLRLSCLGIGWGIITLSALGSLVLGLACRSMIQRRDRKNLGNPDNTANRKLRHRRINWAADGWPTSWAYGRSGNRNGMGQDQTLQEVRCGLS